MSDRDLVRIEELLIDRALGQLSDEAAQELRVLLSESPEAAIDDYERIAAEAAAALVLEGGAEELPAALADSIVDRAAGKGAPAPDISPDRVSIVGRSGRWVTASGWLAAAAALIAWAVIPERAVSPPPESGEALAALRESLVSGGADVARLEWSATDDPAAAAASGDVVWSAAQQTGFMRFAGLEPNDPTEFQYQLWIFDSTRDDRYPVDGGVFDVTPDGEVIVRIDPKVRVRDAALFAVTIEQPGGVVVSERERIVLVAQTG